MIEKMWREKKIVRGQKINNHDDDEKEKVRKKGKG